MIFEQFCDLTVLPDKILHDIITNELEQTSKEAAQNRMHAIRY